MNKVIATVRQQEPYGVIGRRGDSHRFSIRELIRDILRLCAESDAPQTIRDDTSSILAKEGRSDIYILWSLDSILLLFVLLHQSLANFCLTDRRTHPHQR